MATLPKYAFLNGEIRPYEDSKVGLLTHALHYGTGVFGGLRGYWNEAEEQMFVFRPRDHFKRVRNSARLLLMKIPFEDEFLVQSVSELIRKEGYQQDCYVRPLVYLSVEEIGVRLNGMASSVAIVTVPFGRYVQKEEGAHVTISSWRRVEDNAIPARGKVAGSYVNSALIKTDALLNGFDEALVLTEDGHLSEGSAENVFMVRDGIAITPPITDNILEGITRRTLIHMLQEDLGMEVQERKIDRTELYLADELLFCGTGVQIVAITQVDHRPIGDGTMGPVVTQLRDLYFNTVRGNVPKYRHWCEPVYVRETAPGD